MSGQADKIQAYYHWLRERGQAYTAFAAASPGKRVALAFIGDGAFTAEERDMLVKIAAALGVGAGEVSFNECLTPKAIVLLGFGAKAPDGPAPQLLIDHPRELIKNPQLKRQAWAQLQSIKQYLV